MHNDTLAACLDILGTKVTDKVTGFKGTATSICFDLYGCVQVCINPGTTERGALGDTCWLDLNRLTIKDAKHVLPVPDFSQYTTTPQGPENTRPNLKRGPR